MQRRGERTFQSGAQMLAERVPATRRCSGTSSASPCCPEQTGGGALEAPSTRGAPRPMGGESTEASAAAGFVRAQNGIGAALGRVGGVPIQRGGRRWRGSIGCQLVLVCIGSYEDQV